VGGRESSGEQPLLSRGSDGIPQSLSAIYTDLAIQMHGQTRNEKISDFLNELDLLLDNSAVRHFGCEGKDGITGFSGSTG
jgi:hypothetical protein